MLLFDQILAYVIFDKVEFEPAMNLDYTLMTCSIDALKATRDTTEPLLIFFFPAYMYDYMYLIYADL